MFVQGVSKVLQFILFRGGTIDSQEKTIDENGLVKDNGCLVRVYKAEGVSWRFNALRNFLLCLNCIKTIVYF